MNIININKLFLDKRNFKGIKKIFLYFLGEKIKTTKKLIIKTIKEKIKALINIE